MKTRFIVGVNAMPPIYSRADSRSSLPPQPKYFDQLIEAYGQGQAGRFVHLGYWDAESPLRATALSDDCPFEIAQRRLNDFVLGRLPIQNGQSVLDVGCGFGGTIAQINDQYADMQLTGLNVDARQLAICESLASQNANQLSWVQADACDLPFGLETFDHLICMEAMFHFRSRRAFLQDAARVLKPNGTLVVTDILIHESLLHRDLPLFVMFSTLRTGYGPWPEIQTTPLEWEQLARQSGLTVRARFDLSRNTVPSHEYTLPDGLTHADVVDEPELQAAMMLRWLHERNLVRYLCYSLVRS